jgi:drug/metabolite transporter (DMT)-like permease
MSSTAGSVVAALGGAGLFALASAVQHQEARAVARSVSPSLLLTLARRPLWLLGIVADIGAVGLQAVALALGPVSLVQTLLVAGLPLAALLSAMLTHRRLRRHEVVGLLLCSGGLALLGPALSSTTLGHVPSRSGALVAALVVAAVTGVLLLLRGHPRYGGICAGAAAGVVIGAGAVLLAVAAGRFGDWWALFGSWALYGAIVVGLVGLLLAQVAFQTGELGPPLAALSVVEPLVAVALAGLVLRERLPTGAGTRAVAVTGAVLAVAGVVALCRDSDDLPVTLEGL